VKKSESALDDQLVPLLVKSLRILVVTIGILFILQNFGYNITSLIVGLNPIAIILILTLILVFKEFRNSNIMRKQEYYRNLELSSLDLFKTAIDKPQLSKLYSTQIDQNVTEEEKLGLDNYAASMLCLFEIHYNLRLDKEINSEIFATWMPWIYDVCKGEYFRKVWKEDAFYEKASKLLNNDPIIKDWLKNLNEDT
jgi:hypothetical protein